jgi:NADP-dependent 3-hydroxy acid dehydrogenase YdfG
VRTPCPLRAEGPLRTGQKSLNSGASPGTGEATALARARTGAAVPLAAHRTGRIGALAAEIERGGGRAIAITTDVGEEKHARANFPGC